MHEIQLLLSSYPGKLVLSQLRNNIITKNESVFAFLFHLTNIYIMLRATPLHCELAAVSARCARTLKRMSESREWSQVTDARVEGCDVSAGCWGGMSLTKGVGWRAPPGRLVGVALGFGRAEQTGVAPGSPLWVCEAAGCSNGTTL